MSCLTANSMATRARSTFGVRGQNDVSGNIVIGELVELIPQLPPSPSESGKIYGYLLKVRPDTNWHASQEIGQDGCVTAYMTNSMSSYGGGTIALPRIGEEVVIISSSGGSSNPYMYIGALHGKIYPWPFNGDADNTSNSALTGTGFRVPDLVISPTESEVSPDTNTNEYAKQVSVVAPGSSVHYSSAGLLDKNLFFTRAADYSGKVETREVKDATAVKSETCSDPFGKAQRALEGCSDKAYQSKSTKGYGFNEIMIRSRQASGSKNSNSNSNQYTQWTPTVDGIPTVGGISLYGQDYVDQWSTGTMSMQSLGNMAVGSGEVLNIEAGREINLRVGRSGITINQSGVTISQNNGGSEGYATTWELSAFGIDAFAPMVSMSCNFYELTTGWSTFSMAPGTLKLEALISASMSSGLGAIGGIWSLISQNADAIAQHQTLKKQYSNSVESNSREEYRAILAVSELLGWPMNPSSIYASEANLLPAVETAQAGSITELVTTSIGFAIDLVFIAFKKKHQLGPSEIMCAGSAIDINAGRTNTIRAWQSNGEIHITGTKAVTIQTGSNPGQRVEGANKAVEFAVMASDTFADLGLPSVPGILYALAAIRATWGVPAKPMIMNTACNFKDGFIECFASSGINDISTQKTTSALASVDATEVAESQNSSNSSADVLLDGDNA